MNMRSLIHLRISHCKNLRCIPEEILGCLVRLQELRIGGFSEEQEEFPGLSSIQCLNTSLRSLILIGWKTLKHLPPQIQHLTSLRDLFIFKFNQVEVLLEWLGRLLSLQILFIQGCNNLKYLLNSAEAMQRLLELPFLDIRGCPELKERFAKEKGPECSRISSKVFVPYNQEKLEAKFRFASTSNHSVIIRILAKRVGEVCDLLKTVKRDANMVEIGKKPEHIMEGDYE